MKSIILICALIAGLSNASAEDFYSVNDALLNANQAETVRKNALAELNSHGDSIEANYFMAVITLRETSKAAPSDIYADNRYVEKFEALYRADAKRKQLMYGGQIMVSDIRFLKLFYYLGLKYYSRQNFSKAVEWLNLAKVGYEDNPEFNFKIGTGYYAIKNYGKAKEAFESVLKVTPNHRDTLYNMACLYAVLNNPGESVKWLKKVVNLEPKYKEMASKDSDFDSIRNVSQFQQLVSR
ncbi:MAG TPA: hypothetical protein VGD24_03965 [Gallionella sp.]